MIPTDADRRLVAGCLLGSFVGTDAPAWLLAAVRDGLGGVLLFAQNVVDDAQVARLCGQLRGAHPDVIIAIDEEGGDVTRLDAAEGSGTPCPAAFGFVDDPALTTDATASLGARLSALGIDLTLAPCADLNSNPLNPIIGVRAYGSTVGVVNRHVAAAVTGFRSGGVSVCAKHFPGHGDTSEDTHLGTARIDATMDLLERRELLPFAAAIDAGAEAVLTAHLVAPALDSAPVSLSAAWSHHLRSTMGFEGVIITDALDMDGVAEGRGIRGVADAAVRALAAHADMLCLGSNFDAVMTEVVIDEVALALAEGRLDRDRLLASRKRIAGLRRERPLRPRLEHASNAARRVAQAAVVVDGHIPAGPFAVLECRPRLSMASFNVAWGVAADLGAFGWQTTAIAESDDLAAACSSFVCRAGDAPIAVVVRDAGVHTWQRDVIARCAASCPALVVVELGWPSPQPPECGAYVITHGAARVSAQVVIDMLRVGRPESKEG
ncbi:MAG: glycoside hydrolase, family 3 domain protein [Ilumatobacteraceae bacterium]|nr:glycoside hydrolase, family 3 domain protein [Ilumatobacteraceae bacterium]